MTIEQLERPSVSVLFFYSQDGKSDPCDAALLRPWQERLNLTPEEAPAADSCRYGGRGPDGTRLELCCCLAHDIYLLRLTLSAEGNCRPESWTDWQHWLATAAHAVHASPVVAQPWGASWIFHGLVPAGADGDQCAALLARPLLPGIDAERASRADATPFGWLWLLEDGDGPELGECWQRRVVLLTPAERAAATLKYLVEPLNQGLARIELYLQKGLHHARQLEMLRGTLRQSWTVLQGGIVGATRAGDQLSAPQHQKELERISRHLMRFLTQKAQTEILVNSLRSNHASLVEHLQRVRLEAPQYRRAAGELEREVEQGEVDLVNARVVSESTYAFQDLHRSVEAARLERAGFLMGGAATLLTAFAIFNNVMDIWVLAVEGSAVRLPSPWFRVLIALLASGAFPACAYWTMERRKGPAIAALVVGLLALAAAVGSTLLINP